MAIFIARYVPPQKTYTANKAKIMEVDLTFVVTNTCTFQTRLAILLLAQL